jgi:hypothetical protein
MPNIISQDDFKTYCASGQLYTGEVEGLGYVYWAPRHFRMNTTGLPSETTYNVPQNSEFVVDSLYEMVVIKKSDNLRSKNELQSLKILTDISANAVNVYSIINSYQAMSTTPVTLGAKYLQINPQGTIIHNPNRVYTTKGAIAGGLSKRILGVGVIVDWTKVATGQQSWQKATVNTAVNIGIYAIGTVCPPAAIVLGIAWFIISSSPQPKSCQGSYEEIHGSICPAVSTRVVKPYIQPIQIKNGKSINPSYNAKEQYFNQGRRW